MKYRQFRHILPRIMHRECMLRDIIVKWSVLDLGVLESLHKSTTTEHGLGNCCLSGKLYVDED